MSERTPADNSDGRTYAKKSRLKIIAHYFTGGGGREFDTYRNPNLYDQGAHSKLYRRDNLARGVADVVGARLSTALRANILDIGAGTGILTLELANRDHTVTALDLFPEPLERLHEKAARIGRAAQVKTVQHDMNEGSLPFKDDQFDTVVSLRANRYIQDFDNWVGEARRVLKPGGRFILPVFIIDAIPWRRHSNLGWHQPTGVSRLAETVAASGLIVNEAELRYAEAVSTNLGERDVPLYYRPTFIVAENPPAALPV